MRERFRPGGVGILRTAWFLATVATAGAETDGPAAAARRRNLDLRPAAVSPAADPAPAQESALARWRARWPELLVERDPATGAVRSLVHPRGFLTEADALPVRPEIDPEVRALEWVRSELDLLGLEADDLSGIELTRSVQSGTGGLTHLRFEQRFRGIPTYNAPLQLSIDREGRILQVHNALVPRLAGKVNRTEPGIEADAAISAAAASVAEFATLRRAEGARLVFLPFRDGGARLAWNFQVQSVDRRHHWDMTVDAESAQLWTRIDWVAEGGPSYQYEVYPQPFESPNHTTPLPPGDGRNVITGPAHPTASPFAWHDTNGAAGPEFTITRGNNVYACLDANGNDLCDGGSAPDGGAELEFIFPIALGSPPSAYVPATIVNLFYWTNYLHDLLYLYGFDETAGNFQQNNYGNGGLGADYLRADAQNNGCTNNAFFATPPDGTNPRLELCLGTIPNPDVDGGLDNGLVAHEYSHGLSRRLVGVSCLGNDEQMGEGWGDFLALAVTARLGDQAEQSRPFGTYFFGQPTSGPGVRPAPYSTALAVNGFTYGDLPGLSIPHEVGFLWASMLWDVYWELIDAHGFNPVLMDPESSGGNVMALQLMVGGLKIQPCSGGFVSARDAIIAADVALNGGENVCGIWKAFAKRGLGYSADQGSPESITDGVEAFDSPPSCPSIFFDDFEIGSPARWTDEIP